MTISNESNMKDRYYTWLLVLAIVLVAATLRSPITSVSPMIPIIRDELEVSNVSIGLVNTIPLILLAVFFTIRSKYF